VSDAEIVQRGYDVAISCKTAEQIKVSGSYLELVSRRLETEKGHRDFMLMLDRLIGDTQENTK